MDIYNSWDASYKSIFGALRIGQVCDFSIRIPNNTQYEGDPVMIIFRTGFKERFLPMLQTDKTDEYTQFTASYTSTFMGIHYYYFGMYSNGHKFFIKKQTASKGAIGQGALFQLTVYDDLFETPDFIKGGIIYQIFPDRFCNSKLPKDNIPTDRFIHENWGETPLYRPDEKGHVWNNDYFGGDLQGIIEKLPYLNELGVTCIYLNPIFEAHENHRYNTANYLKVDPHLGTNEDFQELCEKAKDMDISVILDGVFSHTGADSIYFNKFNRYDEVGAYNSETSQYNPWYSFYTFPDKYEAWWGIDTLPNVNETKKEYLNFICGAGGVLEYWLGLGASGYRLDVADELPDGFLDELNKCVKNSDKQNLIIGEVWEDASNKESYGVKRRYLLGNQLDSVMNYPFKEAILSYVTGGSTNCFIDSIMTILENYPKPSIDTLMNFLSTHDVMRAITSLGGDCVNNNNKDWQAEHYMSQDQYNFGKSRLKSAMVLQYFLPGVPSIYYGDEVGLQGYGDPFNRRCFPWGNEDTDLLDFTKELGNIRKQINGYLSGNFIFLNFSDNYICFARLNETSTKAAIIILNRSSCELHLNIIPSLSEKCDKYNFIRGNLSENELYLAPFDYSVIQVTLKRR